MNCELKNPKFYMNYENFKTAEEAPVLAAPIPYSLDDVDDDEEKFEISCICNKQSDQCSLVQCEKCGYWFHRGCVFIPRKSTGEFSNFYCPFCLQQKIRCQCGDSSKYNEELIKCEKCHFHVHKRCELTDPSQFKHFICSHCIKQNENDNGDGLTI